MTPVAASRAGSRGKGYTLVEVLVTMGIFGLLSTILLSLAISISQVTEDTRKLSNVNEESRLAMERLTRELRQANEVLHLGVPADANDEATLTFWTNFDGDSAIKDYYNPADPDADPEVLTYRWSPATKRLTLTAERSNNYPDETLPRSVLAASVSDFSIDLYSSKWEYDDDSDGSTHWTEIDSPNLPGGDGQPDEFQLNLVDLVKVTVTVVDGGHRQAYSTEVDLRNRNQN